MKTRLLCSAAVLLVATGARAQQQRPAPPRRALPQLAQEF